MSLATDKKRLSMKGAKALSDWLAYCLSIGWSKESLDDLQAIWEKHHDEDGKLFPQGSAK